MFPTGSIIRRTVAMGKTAKTSPWLGKTAPDFTLIDQNGATVSLRSFKGKQRVILIFYPGDRTPGCTMQLCAIRDDWQKFITAGIAVFGINHGDAGSHRRFRDDCGLPFPLLVDADKKVSSKFDATYKIGPVNVIRRTVVGIDTNGTVVYYRRGIPKDADILKAILTKS